MVLEWFENMSGRHFLGSFQEFLIFSAVSQKDFIELCDFSMSIEFVLSILNPPWEICTKKLSYTKGPLLAIEHKGPQKKVLNKSISNYVVKNFLYFIFMLTSISLSLLLLL